MTLKTRKPTGAVPWPCILLEGEEKAGKSWQIALLSASKRVGTAYWLDLGEGAADEYGAIEGADYEVIDHDGTWHDITEQIDEIRHVATKALAAGKPPVVLGVDSMTLEWEMLSRYADDKARGSKSNRKLLADDPNAEINIGTTYWNLANARHRQLMAKLLTFPGIVVLTARGKEVAEMGKDGNPVPNKKTYKVEAQKGLPYDATAWVRMYRQQNPELIGARSVHAGIVPGQDKPRILPNFTVEKLVFDILRCDPKTSHVRDVRPLDARSADEQLTDAKNRVWDYAQQLGWNFDAFQRDYAEHHNGTDVRAATADQLDEYLADLMAEQDTQTQSTAPAEEVPAA